MVFFTISIIGINVIYSIIVLVLFGKEYALERMEASAAQRERRRRPSCTHVYARAYHHNMGDSDGNIALHTFRRKISFKGKAKTSSDAQAEANHTLNPRRHGRNTLGLKSMDNLKRKLEYQDNLEIGMQSDMDNAAAFLLKPTADSSQENKKTASRTDRSKTAVLPVNSKANYFARKLKARMMQRKLGLTPAQVTQQRAVERFERHRLMKLNRAEICKTPRKEHRTEFIQVKLWGVPTGIKLHFLNKFDGEFIVKKVKSNLKYILPRAEPDSKLVIVY